MSKIIAANFKMNQTPSETIKYASEFLNKKQNFKSKVIFCPPFTSIYCMAEKLKGSTAKIGGQNCHFKNSGAFTGEISPKMLKNSGADYVILGHSERKTYFDESNELIGEKIKAALENNLHIISGFRYIYQKANVNLDYIKIFKLFSKEIFIVFSIFHIDISGKFCNDIHP